MAKDLKKMLKEADEEAIDVINRLTELRWHLDVFSPADARAMHLIEMIKGYRRLADLGAGYEFTLFTYRGYIQTAKEWLTSNHA